MQDVRIFGLSGTERYAQRVADYLDMPLSPHTEKYFSDTESYLKSDVNVRGYECYIIHSTYGDDDQSVGEKWWNLLVFIGSLIDASSGEISVICPYWGYSRQDRKTESRAPITTKYVGHLLKSMGVRRAITMDVHNLGAYQNAAPISPPALTVDNLELKNLLADFILGIGDYTIPDPIVDNPEDIVVLSPDSGGIGRCRRFRNTMENKLNKMLGREVKIGLASIDKERITHINGDDKLISATVTGGDDIIGDVDGKRVIILDDLIASGKTIGTSVAAIKRDGGELWAAAATHGVFVGEADEHLKEVPRLIIADTIPPFRLDRDSWKDRLHVIPTAKIFAQAIRRTHEHGSISELIQA